MAGQETIGRTITGSREQQLRLAQQRAFDQISTSLQKPPHETRQSSHDAVEQMIDAFEAYLSAHYDEGPS